ncbi:hypothetical protein [Anaeromyxobacter oryzae]|uniref:Chromosomal replication initiator DnaA C-terminal domain-containing protein n=1 Tax=Anaeromyxobacter oryzae TaxID=2918170 RepID=A0ABM7WQI6_9BACT|nr:hypothetical protein [Anaeromyxobacter oryzae]BDG01723.1 hypothetical protein AMOR_07190 [Anaeromyxobacter oryzae]
MGGAVAVGLLIEEQRGEITETWRRAVEDELGGEPAIGFAVGPFLRELSLALRGDVPPSRPRGADGLQRCTVLVRSGAQPARVAREFKLLHRAIWSALRRAGRIIAADERRAADEWLDEALAASLDRLERVRMRIDLLERGPAVVPASREGARPVATPPARIGTVRPPPLPQARPAAARPPPLPAWLGHVGE